MNIKTTAYLIEIYREIIDTLLKIYSWTGHRIAYVGVYKQVDRNKDNCNDIKINIIFEIAFSFYFRHIFSHKIIGLRKQIKFTYANTHNITL